jgi:hypothetical protein
MREGEEKKKKKKHSAVINLPAGHKVVLDEFPEGSIIEIATWKGLGRPDDSTERFLISNEGVELSPSVPHKAIVQPTENLVPLVSLTTNPDFASLEEALNPKPVNYIPDLKSDFSSQKVSNSKVEQSSESNEGNDLPQANNIQRAKTIVWKSAASLAIIAVFFWALNLVGLSIVNPTDSTAHVVGGVSNSLVIYKRSNGNVVTGSVIYTNQPSHNNVNYIAQSTRYDGVHNYVFTKTGAVVIPVTQIKGNIVAVLPVIGVLFKWL